MSIVSYISFPRPLNAVLLSEIEKKNLSGYGITYDITGWRKDMYLFPRVSPIERGVIIVNAKDACFVDCFSNEFIYGILIVAPDELARKRASISASDLDDVAKQHELNLLEKQIRSIYIKSLCDFIHDHINIGEFVELYKVWTDHMDNRFESPTHVASVTLNEVVSSQRLPFAGIRLAFSDRHKTIIFKG